MKIGDLIKRKKDADIDRKYVGNGVGVAVAFRQKGIPLHSCVTVLYPATGNRYDMAVSLMEVISEGR